MDQLHKWFVFQVWKCVCYAAFTWNQADGKADVILVDKSRIVKFDEAIREYWQR